MKEKRFAYENLPEDYQILAENMNLDAENIPPYELPELPINEQTTVEEFEKNIRPHLLDEFYRSMYGVIPPCCEKLEFKVIEFNKDNKRIILSHSRIAEDATKAEARKAAPKKAAKKEEETATTQIEKTTLGDLDALQALKEQLSKSEK